MPPRREPVGALVARSRSADDAAVVHFAVPAVPAVPAMTATLSRRRCLALLALLAGGCVVPRSARSALPPVQLALDWS